ncbi:PilX N-terminal domain-containing pilus assembly protein [Pseudomonas sp. GCM10022188]|uniref:PilX N-terminal domain-containing pilus assembly protein n=1 Tax=Pseudomonas TaxID=286 RepID=UPI001E62057C|nr:PilX N-terminal domain-containing pilus assembly protein [Pseudomonas oryzagri]MCC6073757.1 hypothetical protein [Pseudomonas oryzagri]
MIKQLTAPRQRGATLVVGLIMLLLFTLLVASAFTLSSTNLKAVGNMQARDEVMAAANIAIARLSESPFTDDPAAESINVDMNNDGAIDYVVSMAEPVCSEAVEVPATVEGLESGVRSGIVTPDSQWNTVWDIEATVDDPVTGASVTVKTGVRVLLSQIQKNAVCL